MIYKKVINRTKGTIASFKEFSARAAGDEDINTMEASMESNTQSVSIVSQSFNAAKKLLEFQINFNESGRAVVYVATTLANGDIIRNAYMFIVKNPERGVNYSYDYY